MCCFLYVFGGGQVQIGKEFYLCVIGGIEIYLVQIGCVQMGDEYGGFVVQFGVVCDGFCDLGVDVGDQCIVLCCYVKFCVVQLDCVVLIGCLCVVGIGDYWCNLVECVVFCLCQFGIGCKDYVGLCCCYCFEVDVVVFVEQDWCFGFQFFQFL